ncbi:sensor histidine kinase [Heyndrickxia sporothermodurans]
MRIKWFWNKISIKLLIAIITSFSISLFIAYIILYNFNRFHLLPPNRISVDQYNLIVNTLTVIVILSFIISFLLIIRNKIKYLKLITNSVQNIANGKLGSTIIIKGNDELAQLSRNINLMSKELENKFEHERQIENAKNELITNISHDLRTPLTSIIGYLDLLRKKEYKNDDQLTDYVETIYSKSQELKSLINELFEYTKLTSPDVKLSFSVIDLGGLLEQIIGEYIPIFEKEGLRFQKSIPDEDLLVSMDVEEMVRVYDNLFMNAKKYSAKPTFIKINLDSDGKNALLSISNQVADLQVEDVNQLFERFYRGDRARKEDGGSGLGLAISKRIVEIHGGNLTVDYKEGWLTFTIEHRLKE